MFELRHVFICGAHSTGKTTLVERFRQNPGKELVNLKIQSEIAREIVKENNFTQESLQNPATFLKLNTMILRKVCDVIMMQETQFHHDVSSGDAVMMWDRGVFDPLTYIAEFVGEEAWRAAESEEHVKKMLERSKNKSRSLFFVIKPEPEFLCDDGVRYQSGGFESLLNYHNHMMSLMRMHCIDFIEINTKNLNERVRIVTEAIVKEWKIDKHNN